MSGIQRQLLRHQKIASKKESEQFARELASLLNPGDVVAFFGDLGTGKTFIIQHICKGLKTLETVTSPTFTILNEYHNHDGLRIYHFDFYRVTHEAELQNLGLDEFFYGDGICLIEWADKIEPYLPSPRYEIYLQLLPDNPSGRELKFYRVQ